VYYQLLDLGGGILVESSLSTPTREDLDATVEEVLGLAILLALLGVSLGLVS
jgi:hypothetical protein